MFNQSYAVILSDIEGTTTSIAFVHQVLFPYARKHIRSMIQAFESNTLEMTADQKEILDLAICTIKRHDHVNEADEISDLLEKWIDQDLKETSLKSIQGVLWQKGYEQGAFQGHVYADAYERLKQWHDQNLPMYLFSSGSVDAQKRLFQYSTYGDLRGFWRGYFDTNVGSKREVLSYQKIAQEICQREKVQTQEILFLSDILEELEAAKQAGMSVAWSIRDENGLHADKLASGNTLFKFKSFAEI
jgi:enolase-phosphatase E1